MIEYTIYCFLYVSGRESAHCIWRMNHFLKKLSALRVFILCVEESVWAWERFKVMAKNAKYRSLWNVRRVN